MTGLFENNVVVFHNINAFGEHRDNAPIYKAVFAFEDPDFDDHHDLAWVAERCFVLFNGAEPDHYLTTAYYGNKLRSLSVTDVLFINGSWWECNRFGWSEIERPASERIIT